MPIAPRRSKVLFLPVIRGIFPVALTKSVKAEVRQAVEELHIDAILPADDAYTQGIIRSDDDVARYYQAWRQHMPDIKAVIAFSGDFMRERVIQDTVRLLPPDVPVFLIVNNDNPAELVDGKVGDSLCGTLSVHHNLRMLGRRVVRSCRIDMHDQPRLKQFLAEYQRLSDGIETLRNMRVAMLGTNPDDFATTFTNQLKLFELGFSLHSYELMTLWGDTMLTAQTDDAAASCKGPFGEVKFFRPIRKGDKRVSEVKAKLTAALGQLPEDSSKLDAIARCFLWVQDTFELDRIDAGAIHCWPEFQRFFGMSPCAFAMAANLLLAKPLVCETDICHAIMAKLAWSMTGEPGVILDINNSGWDQRVFNVFHCSQTPPNWLIGRGRLSRDGRIEGTVSPVPFTAISAATSADAFSATVFQGQMLTANPGTRGSSGWAFVPNLQEVLKSIESAGIHHFVALKGHIAGEVAEVLRFRGLAVEDKAQPVQALEAVEAGLPPLDARANRPLAVFSA